MMEEKQTTIEYIAQLLAENEFSRLVLVFSSKEVFDETGKSLFGETIAPEVTRDAGFSMVGELQYLKMILVVLVKVECPYGTAATVSRWVTSFENTLPILPSPIVYCGLALSDAALTGLVSGDVVVPLVSTSESEASDPSAEGARLGLNMVRKYVSGEEFEGHDELRSGRLFNVGCGEVVDAGSASFRLAMGECAKWRIRHSGPKITDESCPWFLICDVKDLSVPAISNVGLLLRRILVVDWYAVCQENKEIPMRRMCRLQASRHIRDTMAIRDRIRTVFAFFTSDTHLAATELCEPNLWELNHDLLGFQKGRREWVDERIAVYYLSLLISMGGSALNVRRFTGGAERLHELVARYTGGQGELLNAIKYSHTHDTRNPDRRPIHSNFHLDLGPESFQKIAKKMRDYMFLSCNHFSPLLYLDEEKDRRRSAAWSPANPDENKEIQDAYDFFMNWREMQSPNTFPINDFVSMSPAITHRTWGIHFDDFACPVSWRDRIGIRLDSWDRHTLVSAWIAEAKCHAAPSLTLVVAKDDFRCFFRNTDGPGSPSGRYHLCNIREAGVYTEWVSAEGDQTGFRSEVAARRKQTMLDAREYINWLFNRYQTWAKLDSCVPDYEAFFLVASLSPFVEAGMKYHYAFPVYVRPPFHPKQPLRTDLADIASLKIASSFSIGMKSRALLPEERRLYSEFATRLLFAPLIQDYVLHAAIPVLSPAHPNSESILKDRLSDGVPALTRWWTFLSRWWRNIYRYWGS